MKGMGEQLNFYYHLWIEVDMNLKRGINVKKNGGGMDDKLYSNVSNTISGKHKKEISMLQSL